MKLFEHQTLTVSSILMHTSVFILPKMNHWNLQYRILFSFKIRLSAWSLLTAKVSDCKHCIQIIAQQTTVFTLTSQLVWPASSSVRMNWCRWLMVCWKWSMKMSTHIAGCVVEASLSCLRLLPALRTSGLWREWVGSREQNLHWDQSGGFGVRYYLRLRQRGH